MTRSPLLYGTDGRLRAVWRVLAFIVLSVAFTILASVPVALVQERLGMLERMLAAQLALVAGFLLAHVVMLRVLDPRPWSDVGLGKRHAEPRLLLWSLLLGGAAIAVPMAALLGVRWLAIEPAPPGSWLAFAVVTLLFFLPAALIEELMMRGYLFRVLRDAWGWLPTVLVTSVVFSALHWGNPNGCLTTWRAGAFDAQTCAQSTALVTLAGIVLGGVLVFTGSLFAAWIAHFAWNWTMTGLLHASVSGVSDLPGITMPNFRVVDAGPDVVTGGSWGPEGGVLAAIAMIVAFVALWRQWQRGRIGDGVA